MIALGLLSFTMYLILVGDKQQPMLTFIRTFSKFYRTFFFQGVGKLASDETADIVSLE